MLANGNYIPSPLQQLGGQFSQALQSTGPWGSTVATPTDSNMPTGENDDQSLAALAASIPGTNTTAGGSLPALPPIPADLVAAMNNPAAATKGQMSPLSAIAQAASPSSAPMSPGLAGMQSYSQLLAQQAGQLPALQQQQQSNRAALLQALNNLTQQQANYKPPSQINQPLMNMVAGFLSSPNEATALGAGLKGYGDASAQQAAQERAQNNLVTQEQMKDAMLPEAFSEEDVKNAMDAAKEGVTAEKMQQMLAMQMPGGVAGIGGVPTSGSAQAHGDDFLQVLPATEAAQVKALAEGRMQFPSGFALKSPYWQGMLSAVSQYDPNFDAVNYNARNKTYSDFTSGKSAQNITALNTAMGHLGTLNDAFGSLNNTSIPIANQIKNYIGTQAGDPNTQAATSAVSTDANAVANEMAKVFRSSGMSQADIEEWRKQINANSTPEQAKSVIKSAVQLMNSRIDALGEQYNKGMGTSKNGVELLSPEAQLSYAKLTGIPPKTTVAQGAGTQIPVNNSLPASPDEIRAELAARAAAKAQGQQ